MQYKCTQNKASAKNGKGYEADIIQNNIHCSIKTDSSTVSY